MRTNLSEKIVVPGRRLNLKRIQTRSFRHEYVYFCRARKTLRADERTGRGAPADSIEWSDLGGNVFRGGVENDN